MDTQARPNGQTSRIEATINGQEGQIEAITELTRRIKEVEELINGVKPKESKEDERQVESSGGILNVLVGNSSVVDNSVLKLTTAIDSLINEIKG